MNSCELTASITALANMIASKLSSEELAVIAPALIQLGYTLETISRKNEICCKNKSPE